MIKFTDEEISLCKQVAEKWRKDKLERGDWYLLYLLNGGEQIRLHDEIRPWIILTKDYIPLWTISDCLEFLRERNFEMSLCYFNKFSGYRIQIWKPEITQAFYSDYDLDRSLEQCTHKTPLEACLKAILAVLVEGK